MSFFFSHFWQKLLFFILVFSDAAGNILDCFVARNDEVVLLAIIEDEFTAKQSLL